VAWQQAPLEIVHSASVAHGVSSNRYCPWPCPSVYKPFRHTRPSPISSGSSRFHEDPSNSRVRWHARKRDVQLTAACLIAGRPALFPAAHIAQLCDLRSTAHSSPRAQSAAARLISHQTSRQPSGGRAPGRARGPCPAPCLRCNGLAWNCISEMALKGPRLPRGTKITGGHAARCSGQFRAELGQSG